MIRIYTWGKKKNEPDKMKKQIFEHNLSNGQAICINKSDCCLFE